MMVARLAIAGVVLVAAGCSPTPTEPSSNVEPSSTFATAHFLFAYGAADAASVPAIAAYVEERYARVVEDLRVGSMPVVQVRFYDTHAAMADAVRPVAGTIPSWATGLVTASDRIHMLSPAATAVSREQAGTTVVHEFAHCVTLAVDAASGNNPRWLWEAIALYEAGQRVDPRNLAYVVAGEVPGLAALNDISNRQIYDLGYLLAEFIVSLGGTDALRALVLARGDTARVLGLETVAFEARWREFLRQP